MTDEQKIRILQERIDELECELQARKNYFLRDAVEFRGIFYEDRCLACDGMGIRSYENTSTWRHGAGGQSITNDVCDACWGSGNTFRPWKSWKKE